MEGLIFLLILWSIGKALAKQGKKAAPHVKKFSDMMRENMGGSDIFGDIFGSPQPASPPKPIIAAPVASIAPVDGYAYQSGSLTDYVSTEGMDPCHDEYQPVQNRMIVMGESIEVPRPNDAPLAHDVSPIMPSFTKDSLVQAVIMSEILTRPCDRKRRYSA